MRLRVIHEGGEIEIITLVPPITGALGSSLNRLACGDGTDFFFTPEGFYDGWGRRGDGMTKDQIDEAIQRMEDGREVDDGT